MPVYYPIIKKNAKLQEKTVIENGTVTPDQGFDGLSKVTVSVAGGGGMSGFHMVRFFNDDRTTLLYTVFVPDGASAIYAGETPVSTEDGGAPFAGFEPAAVNVTEDMDCFAVYELAVGTLDETSWATISKLSAKGEAQNYFAVGDTKMIHIEGTVGTLAVDGDYGVYIIGFDHNEELEGKGIHFGTFKTAVSSTQTLALCDSKGGSSTAGDGTKYFNINHWGKNNLGGWSACDLRYDVLGSTDTPPSNYGAQRISGDVGYDATETCATNPVANTLMAALPADLRAVMKPMTKYTDNVGGATNDNTNVTQTVDYLPLLAEYEIFGARTHANENEQNKQARYAYFRNGNSTKMYKHTATSTGTIWWGRSPASQDGDRFCRILSDGRAAYYESTYSYGLAPIFKV